MEWVRGGAGSGMSIGIRKKAEYLCLDAGRLLHLFWGEEIILF